MQRQAIVTEHWGWHGVRRNRNQEGEVRHLGQGACNPRSKGKGRWAAQRCPGMTRESSPQGTCSSVLQKSVIRSELTNAEPTPVTEVVTAARPAAVPSAGVAMLLWRYHCSFQIAVGQTLTLPSSIVWLPRTGGA